ncbi:hypothetical protein NPX13_g9449 [Xylaria arbuscula]|uniref:Uncharacterized protein n=1 Tax=Xylaria arbuscula TaxID=114810 RepID=A0A9W8N6J8_9PEZI|nr:hypothetical protein NPX13_g9449 [Xylaria arbuscula]
MSRSVGRDEAERRIGLLRMTSSKTVRIDGALSDRVPNASTRLLASSSLATIPASETALRSMAIVYRPWAVRWRANASWKVFPAA